MNRTFSLLLILFLIIFGVLCIINGVAPEDITFERNLIISLVLTGITALYGGLLNLATKNKRNL
jgi:uncharacterized membrane protein YbjE (DUF340 family)